MAARDDSELFEGTINLDSERGQKWARATVHDYLIKTASLLKMLEHWGKTTKQVDERHRRLTKEIVTKITDESGDLIEQAALTAMVGTSMLATFDAQVDYIDLQMSMLEAEEGGA